MTTRRVDVDENLCVGAGQCIAIAPSAFEYDEDFVSRVTPGAEQVALELLQDAAVACPSGAITLAPEMPS